MIQELLLFELCWIIQPGGPCFHFAVVSCYYLFQNTFLASSSRRGTLKRGAKGRLCSLPCAQGCLRHFMSLAVMAASPLCFLFFCLFSYPLPHPHYAASVVFSKPTSRRLCRKETVVNATLGDSEKVFFFFKKTTFFCVCFHVLSH